MALSSVVITSSLSGRTVVRAPFVRDMRERLRACGAEPAWEADAAVWTMPRRTLISIVEAVGALFPDVRINVELESGRWRSFAQQDLVIQA